MEIADNIEAFFIPTITLIGAGSIKRIPKKLRDLNAHKPLIVTDKGIVHSGILCQVTTILDAAQMTYALYDGTVPNPTCANVEEGVAVYKQEGCDSLITLGGGSAHDCGKGIGLVVANGESIHTYEGVNKSSQDLPPYVAVNTTAGTASEITRFCIITDVKRKVKMSIVDWRVTPNVAINDPVLMLGMPIGLTAATGMDALTHAVEAYVSSAATDITDACAEKAIKLVAKHLRTAVTKGSDVEAREGMCYAQYLAGMAFNNAGLGYVHAMAHQLGGRYDLPHGECNAILLPHVQAYNLSSNYEKFATMAGLLGRDVVGLSPEDGAQKFLEAIRELAAFVGIPKSIRALATRYGKSVDLNDIPAMVSNAQKDACATTNPCSINDADLAKLYEAAF